MAKKNKKNQEKERKAYYEKELRKEKIVEKNIKRNNVFSNTTVMLCVDF